ncbi:MAG: GNAT family N-acetyltransferase [Candidatus Dormiibacterota bacterium]
MFELERLRPDHEAAILDFELANRAYFAESISDRGDDFYEHFAERYRALLAEQEAGLSIGHVLVDGHGAVVGRFNLYELKDGAAEVGYRIAQRVAGRGVATSGLRRMCRLARDEYGLRTLRAATSNENAASRRVLMKAGFVGVGPVEVGGRPGARYELALASRRPTAVIARGDL